MNVPVRDPVRCFALPDAAARTPLWRRSAVALACVAGALLAPSGWAQAPGRGDPVFNASSSVVLPALGDVASDTLSPAAERKLGDRIMRAIRRDPDVVDDPQVLEYLDSVWQTLLVAAQRRGETGADLAELYAWEAFLVRDRSVNAFALPGGYIGVHLGLLAMTTTADELASVLGHELSHVTQRHIARMIGQQSRQSLVGIASLVLGMLAASRNPAAAQAMIYGGQAVAIQNQLNFSRDMEREADRIGFGVLTEGGFDPGGMALMFEHLQQASRLNDDGSYPYLRSHPLTSERIGEARSRLGTQAWQNAGEPRAATAQLVWHRLMAARARVLMDPRSESLQRLMGLTPHADQTPLDALAVRYTQALALQKGGETNRALTALQQAGQAALLLPEDLQPTAQRALLLAQIDTLQQSRRYAEAQALWQRESTGPRRVLQVLARPELLLRARLWLSPGTPSTAEDGDSVAAQLQTHVSRHPCDATAWATLGEIWNRLGQPLRAVRADAEATAALGDLPGAIERIQGAQKRFRQPDAAAVIELSVMDARARAWQRQLQDDMRDDR